jgi:aspartate racemase
MQQAELEARIARLSPEKQQLLALRLGKVATQQKESDKKTTLVAFVTVNEAVDGANLREHLRKRLPQYMVPAAITVLDDMPRTPNGKVDREALLRYQPQIAAPQTVETQVQAHDEIEERLLQLWQEMLGMDVISLEDDFFEIGGYSLLAIRMFGQVKQMFQKDLPVSTIFEAPTIAKLANILRKDDKNLAAQTIFTLQPNGDAPALYCFQVHKFGVITYRYLAQYLGDTRPIYGMALPLDLPNPPKTVEGLASYFVEVLLRHQSVGPYYLSGMSIAGLIAYEMARQMAALGIHDVWVVLFDTYGPGYPRMLSRNQAIVQKIKLHTGNLLRMNRDAFWHVGELIWRSGYRFQYQMRRLVKRYQHQMGLKPIETPEEGERYVLGQPFRIYSGRRVYGEALELMEMEEKYFAQPKPFAGNVLLYRATLQPFRATYDVTLRWKQYVSGRLEVRHVRGNHSGIMRHPYVQKLSERLKADLNHLDHSG